MEPKGFHRKLNAILSADVAGSSRLVQDDEAATAKSLEQYKPIISVPVTPHRGRVVGSPRVAPGGICQRGGCGAVCSGDPEGVTGLPLWLFRQ